MKKQNTTLTPEQKETYLLRICAILKKMERVTMMDKSTYLNDSELRMLGEIFAAKKEGKRLISTQIADRLNLTRSAVSQMVNKLEKKGIVKRVADDVDRKIAYIELSESAQEKYQQAKEIACVQVGDVIADFGVAKFEKMCDLVESFTKMVGKHKIKNKKNCAEKSNVVDN